MDKLPRFAFVFPGQGSQYVGMMEDLLRFESVRKIFNRASHVLSEDLSDLVLRGPEEKLNQTFYTQPVMLTAAYATYQLWRDHGGMEPYAVAGHSLGEYTALVVSGVIDFEAAVDCVRFRAKVMQESVPEGSGGMAAIIGISDSILIDICSEVSEKKGVVEAVNFNAPGQIVIAGLKMAVEEVCQQAKIAGAKRTVFLPVSAPFHSSLLASASKRLGEYFNRLIFRKPRIIVVNNVDAESVDDALSIKDCLIRQASHPVKWVDCIKTLVKLSCKPIVECGPGKVLSGLTKRISPQHVGVNLSSFSKIIELKQFLEENRY